MVICISYGCKKETNPAPGVSKTPTCRVKTVRDDDANPIKTVTYEYDAGGKITKTANSDGSYALYQYSGDRLIVKNYNNLDQPVTQSPERTFFLNSQGYIAKEILKFSVFVSDTLEYSYTPDGFLLQETWRGKSSSSTKSRLTTYTIENNNTVKIVSVYFRYNGAQDTVVESFTFLAEENKGGVYQWFFDDARPLDRFRGRPNKNLVNTVTYKGSSINETRTYTYDMKDGLPTYSYYGTSGGSKYEKRKYEFECK